MGTKTTSHTSSNMILLLSCNYLVEEHSCYMFSSLGPLWGIVLNWCNDSATNEATSTSVSCVFKRYLCLDIRDIDKYSTSQGSSSHTCTHIHTNVYIYKHNGTWCTGMDTLTEYSLVKISSYWSVYDSKIVKAQKYSPKDWPLNSSLSNISPHFTQSCISAN